MKNRNQNDVVDDASEESFPASDPPSWYAGPPESELESEKNSLAGAWDRLSQIPESTRQIVAVATLGSAASAGLSFFLGKKRLGYLFGVFTPLLGAIYFASQRKTSGNPSFH